VLARLDDDDAEALANHLDDLDDDELADLGREAATIVDLDARAAWARGLIRRVDRETADDHGHSPSVVPAPTASAYGLDIPPALIPVLAQLSSDEQIVGAQILSVLDRASIEKISAELLAMPTERALATVRLAIANARQRSASVAHRAINSALAEERAKGGAS
jgi:hypothetical protein